MNSIIDIMIVGAQKAGTSTLLRYLGTHPGMRAQVRNEMTYFIDSDLYRQDLIDYWDLYFGIAERSSLVHVGKLAGLMYESEGLERLRRQSPGTQVVAILRDPVRRAYSAFWYARLKGLEPVASFEEALRSDRTRSVPNHRMREYLDRSLYAKHVEHLYELFGRDRVHIFVLEDFQRDAAATVTLLLRHVGLAPAPLSALATTQNAARQPRSFQLARLTRPQSTGALAVKRMLPQVARDAIRHRLRRFNETPWSPPPMRPDTEDELRAYFAGPNRELEHLLGRDLSSLWP